MYGMHRLNIFFVDNYGEILRNISFWLSFCEINFFPVPVGKTISQIHLDLAWLASLVSIIIWYDCVSDVLRNFVFEKLVELGAFGLVLELLLKDKWLGKFDHSILQILNILPDWVQVCLVDVGAKLFEGCWLYVKTLLLLSLNFLLLVVFFWFLIFELLAWHSLIYVCFLPSLQVRLRSKPNHFAVFVDFIHYKVRKSVFDCAVKWDKSFSCFRLNVA